MSKYIIEVEDNAVGGLFKAKGFNALVFDKDGLDKLQKYEEKETADSREFPKVGDTYFYITALGFIRSTVWNDDDIDFRRLAIGNVYKSEEEAEFAIERLKVLAEMEKFAEPLDTKWDGYRPHFYIYYNLVTNSITVDCHTVMRTREFHFESYEIAHDCIEAVGEDRIKKYYLGVE